MAKIDELIHDYLAKKSSGRAPEQGPECPKQEELISYIAGRLGRGQRKALEAHIADCSYCLGQLAGAYEAQQAYKTGQVPEAPQKLVQRARAIAGKARVEPPIRPKILMSRKGLRRHLWLLPTGICFSLSFLFHRYFLQFLAATLIFGGKWIAESNSVRALVMVIDSWRRHSKGRDEQIEQLIKEREQGHRL